MKKLNIPVGISDFEKIRNGGFIILTNLADYGNFERKIRSDTYHSPTAFSVRRLV